MVALTRPLPSKISGCSRRTVSWAAITIAWKRGGGSAAQRNTSGNRPAVQATGVGVGVGVAITVGAVGSSSQPQQLQWKRPAATTSAPARRVRLFIVLL